MIKMMIFINDLYDKDIDNIQNNKDNEKDDMER